MSTPQERVAALMQGYDYESSSADETAQQIAADPELVAVLTPQQRKDLVAGLFDGGTGTNEENAAMTIMLAASPADLTWILQAIGSDDLTDELSDEQVAQLYARAGSTDGLDPTDAQADQVASIIARDPTALAGMTVDAKITLIKSLLDGPTDGDEEEDVKRIFNSITDPSDLRKALREITVDTLLSELDNEVVQELLIRALDFSGLKYDDDDADEIAVAVAGNPVARVQITETDRLLLVRALFDGPTYDEQERAAETLLLASPTGTALERVLCQLTWEALDDELGSAQIDNIANSLATRLDDERSVLRQIAPWVTDPAVTPDPSPFGASITSIIAALSATDRNSLVDALLVRRGSILSEIVTARRRGRLYPVGRIIHTLTRLSASTTHRRTEVDRWRHEVEYAGRAAQSLVDGEYGQMAAYLADLGDAALTEARRLALSEVLARLEPEMTAQKVLIEHMGDAEQRTRLARFTALYLAATSAFSATQPAAVLDRILAEIRRLGETVAGSIDDARSAIARLAGSLLDAANLGAILGTADDDKARAVIGELASTGFLARLSTKAKLALLGQIWPGSTGDEDEDAALKVLTSTKDHDRIELYQLIGGTGWAALDLNLDGEQWDQFMALLVCDSNMVGRSSEKLIVVRESQTGRNELFREQSTNRILTREEVAEAITQGRYLAYHVRVVNGMRIPTSNPDDSATNNLVRPLKAVHSAPRRDPK